jgi:DNA-binding Xre family transcriptional regulator
MITNERQYKISKTELNKFEDAIASANAAAPADDVHPDMHRAMRAGLVSQAEELRQEIARYEKLKSGQVKTRRLDRIGDLQDALVEGRIVAGMTQKELARRVGLAEQQIQRYEGTRYRGVSLERLDEIGSAVGLHVREVVYKVANRPASSTEPRGKTTGSPSGGKRHAAAGGTSRSARKSASSSASQRSGRAAAQSSRSASAGRSSSKSGSRSASQPSSRSGSQASRPSSTRKTSVGTKKRTGNAGKRSNRS